MRALADGMERATGHGVPVPPCDVTFYGDLFLPPPKDGVKGSGQDAVPGLAGLRDAEVADLVSAASEVLAEDELAVASMAAAKGYTADRHRITGDRARDRRRRLRKSAALALLVTLSDPDFLARYAAGVAHVPADLRPRPGAVDVAVLATGKLPHEVLVQICDALDIPRSPTAGSVPSMEDLRVEWWSWLATRQEPVTIVVDALDEAPHPRTLLAEVLAQLNPPDTGQPRIRLVVGVRSPVATTTRAPAPQCVRQPGTGRSWTSPSRRCAWSGCGWTNRRGGSPTTSPATPPSCSRPRARRTQQPATSGPPSGRGARGPGRQVLPGRPDRGDIPSRIVGTLSRPATRRGRPRWPTAYSGCSATACTHPGQPGRPAQSRPPAACRRLRLRPRAALAADLAAGGRRGRRRLRADLRRRRHRLAARLPAGRLLVTDREDDITVYRLFHDALRTTLRERWAALLASPQT